MKRSPETELLRANAAFYDAFASQDMEAMDELWARGLPVVCIHPGWPPLFGRDEVMDSWRAILLGENAPHIECEQPQPAAFGESGFVVCIERIEGDPLVATNTFALQNGVWQLVHHHGGPMNVETAPEPTDRTLN